MINIIKIELQPLLPVETSGRKIMIQRLNRIFIVGRKFKNTETSNSEENN